MSSTPQPGLPLSLVALLRSTAADHARRCALPTADFLVLGDAASALLEELAGAARERAGAGGA